MPKVSVIVPVYNVEKYLNRCIDSILNQKFTDFELILVDDGSPDNCGVICDEYAENDSRVRVVHKENGGVSAARNSGIEVANGEYIMFVDSDDYIDSRMLEDMLKYDSSDIVFSGLKYINEQGEILSDGTVESFDKIDLESFVRKYYIQMEETHIISGPCNKLFKKGIIDVNNIRFNEDISICEDGLFVINFINKANTFSNIEYAYYSYVQYCNDNLMNKYNNNSFEACGFLYKAKKAFIKDIDKISNEYIDQNALNLFIAFFSQIYSRSGMNFIDKYRKVREVLKDGVFVGLVKAYRGKSMKIRFFKFVINAGMAFPLHIIYSIHWLKGNIS